MVDASHPFRQLPLQVETERQRDDRRAEDVADNGEGRVGEEDRPEGRQGEDDDRTEREADERDDDHARLALVASIAAPGGAWAASPMRPPIVVIRPTSDWLQCCSVTRKHVEIGAELLATSISD